MDKQIMLDVMLLVMLFVLGAVFGSFACCQAWRWRYKFHEKKELGKWSVCLNCKKRIKWYDNIPIVSWLVLQGKCRNCHKKIGVADFLAELGMAVAFLMLGWAHLLPIVDNWTRYAGAPVRLALELTMFVLTLAMLVVLMILAVYDAKWGQLPLVLLLVSVVLGATIFVLKMVAVDMAGGNVLAEMKSAGIGVAILSGTCFLIYKISRERLMGAGDWLLALGLALVLANWWLALWAIFLANLLGDLIALPGAIKSKNHVVFFGPFLVAAFVIVMILGNALPVLLSSFAV